MEIKTITASYKFRLDLGNWNSAEFFLSAHGELAEGDDPEAKARELASYCKKRVLNEGRTLLEQMKPHPTVTQFFQGMEVKK